MRVSKGIGKAVSMSAISALGMIFSTGASADVLLSEGFDGVTITQDRTINLQNNPSTTSDDYLNQWIDFDKWSISSGGICSSPCSGSFALHLPADGDHTNLLFYGLSGAGISAGTTLTLGFDYIQSAQDRTGMAYIIGMTNGVHALDPYAPWLNFDPNSIDTDDGVILGSQRLFSQSWTSSSFSVTLSQAYDVFVVGFVMGGGTGTNHKRGIDNVLFTAVPEPGSLALLGLGLLGLGAVRRRN